VFDLTTPTTLYAVTEFGGVYKSTDSGTTWQFLRRSREVRGFALAIAPTTPTTLYVYGRRGVYKSADGGATWRAVNRGLELGEWNRVSALSIYPANPRVIVAGTSSGVYKSENGGETWTRTWISTGLKEVWDVRIDPRNSQVIVAVTDEGVIRSADGGATWRAVTDGLPASNPFSMLLDPAGVMYASIKGDCSHLYRSNDGGATWSRFDIMLASPLDGYGCSRNEEGALRLLAVDPTAPATLYAGIPFSASSGRGLWRSSDGGVSWQPVGLYSHILSLALTPSSLYAGTFNGGVYRSDDLGISWRGVSEGLTGFDVFDLAVDPTTSTTLYAATNNGVHKSDDGGITWRAVGLSGQSLGALAGIPTVPTTLYAGVYYGDEPGVFMSVDDGATWRAAGLPGRSVRALAVHPVEPATLYVGTNDKGDNALFRSTDGGATWSEIVRMRGAAPIAAVVIDPSTPTTVYAASEDGELLRSQDGGATWSRAEGYLIRLFLLVTDPAQPPAIYVGTSLSGVYRQAIDKIRWEPYP